MEIACQAVFLGLCVGCRIAGSWASFHWPLVTALVDKLLNSNWLGDVRSQFPSDVELRGIKNAIFVLQYPPFYFYSTLRFTRMLRARPLHLDTTVWVLTSHLLVAHGLIGTIIVIVMLIDSPPPCNHGRGFPPSIALFLEIF
jgi:hypothetical protein